MSNSPRYVGFTSPPYVVTFIDDSGHRIDLTGANTSLFTWTLQNLTASTSHVGGGAWVITDAVNGEAEYYLTTADVAVAGNCLVFVSIQLPSDSSPREFDPDPLMIEVGAGTTSPAPIPIVQVSGYIAPTYLVGSGGVNKAAVSSSGSVKVDGSGVIQPVSGSITANGGTNLNTSLLALESGGNLATIKNNTTGLATQTTLAAAKTDLDTIATNTSGLATQATLSSVKTDLDSVVTNTSNTATNTNNINTHTSNIDTAIGTPSDAAWSGSGSGTEIALLKKIATGLNLSGTLTSNIVDNTGTNHLAINADGSINNNATGYLYNGGGPGNGNFDLARSLQSKGGLQSLILLDATVGNTYTILSVTPPASLLPGMQVILTGGTAESFYVSAVQGTTIYFTTAIQQTGHTTLIYESFSVLGTAGNGFTGVGVGLAQPVLWNATSSLYYGQSNNSQTGYADVAIGGTKIITGSANALNAYLIPDTDVSAFKFLSLHITGTFSGVASFFQTNDNTQATWPSITLFRPDNLNLATAATAVPGSSPSATNLIYCGAILCSHFRVQMTTYSSGTATCTLVLSAVPPPAWIFTQTTNLGATTVGGANNYHRVSTADTNAVTIKAATGQLYGYDISNTTASWRYVKLFNKATTPVPGTDTPFKTIGVPPGGKAQRDFTNGIAMSLGIGLAAVANIADNDNTAISAGDLDIEVEWR